MGRIGVVVWVDFAFSCSFPTQDFGSPLPYSAIALPASFPPATGEVVLGRNRRESKYAPCTFSLCIIVEEA